MFLLHKKYGDPRKLREVLDKFITLFVVMVSFVFAYVQSYQVVYIKYVQFFVYQLYFKKVVFLKGKEKIKEN